MFSHLPPGSHLHLRRLSHAHIPSSEVRVPLTIKALPLKHTINNQNPMRTPIIRPRDRLEALLSRRVPNLQLNALAVQLDSADLEVDADGGDVRGGEGVFGEAKETVGFADARVADDEELHLEGVSVGLEVLWCLGIRAAW